MSMKKLFRIPAIGLVLFCFVVLATRPVLAHGTEIDYSVGAQVQLVAKFDTGEPMANAQVTVYSPEDPATAWLVGEADAEGNFAFAPDPSIPGRWDIFVRTAGHGDSLYVEFDEAGTAVAGSAAGGLTVPQIVLMSASIIWGFVGTALYFAGRKSSEPADSSTSIESVSPNKEPTLGESVS